MGKQKKTGAPAPASKRRSPALQHVVAPVVVLVAAVGFYFLNAAHGKQAPSAPSIEVDEKTSDVAVEAMEQRVDNYTECAAWAAANECSNNPVFMLHQCAAACAAHGKQSGDSAPLPDGWREYKDESSGRVYYSDGVTSQWERPSAGSQSKQRSDSAPLPDGWREYKDESSGRVYYSDGVTSQWERPSAGASTGKQATSKQAGSTDSVQYEDTWHTPSDCQAWAGSGQCDVNPGFMLHQCEASCHKIGVTRKAYAARCKRPDDAKPALLPGAMPQTFARIMSDFAHLQPEMVSEDPPIVLFHNFLSDEEADTFIKHGKGKYTESKGVGVDKNGRMTDVKTEIRTSSHTWCQEAECLNDPLVAGVIERVSDVTQVPSTNGEFAQLVYYHACPDAADPSCAFYRRHSDYIDGDQHRNQGARIYTLFMYLNDVPEGGGTRFTDLKPEPITFQAQRGKAILWPSVLSDKPDVQDPRTHHEALPVTKGEKFGANFWIHQYDFKTPHKTGCTMD